MELKYYEEEYNKLSKSEQKELHECYKNGTEAKSPLVDSLLKKIKKEEKKVMVKDKGKEEAKKPVEEATPEVPVVPEVVAVVPSKLEVQETKAMTLSETKILAEDLYKSRYFKDATNVQQALTKILAGRELGFGAITSLSKIYIVNERVALEAGLIGALVKRGNEYDYRITRLDNEGCSLVFYKHGKQVGISTFDKEDARRAGLLEKSNWKKYPRNMYFARALSNGGRWYCPEKVYNTYTYEEMGMAVDAQGGAIRKGDVIDIDVEGTSIEDNKPKTQKDIIASLKQKYGVKKLKEVRVEMKFEGKAENLPEKEFKKFQKKVEG